MVQPNPFGTPAPNPSGSLFQGLLTSIAYAVGIVGVGGVAGYFLGGKDHRVLGAVAGAAVGYGIANSPPVVTLLSQAADVNPWLGEVPPSAPQTK